MSDAISSLGLDLDTSKLKAASRDLDAFEAKSRQIEAAATRMEGAFRNGMQAAAGLAGALGIGFAVRELIAYADGWKIATNQLRLATSGIGELQRAQQGVYAIAQQTMASLDATAALAGKLNKYAGDLTGGLEGTLKLVETINKASAIGGTSAASQAAGLFQLNQALASGTLRGEELNSVMEQTPVIARAIADGLGITIGQLRKYAAEGRITSEIVVQALQNQKSAIDEQFKALEPTIAQAGQKLKNALTRLVGEAGDDIFGELADGISKLADALGSDSSVGALAAALDGVSAAARSVLAVLPAVAAGFGAMMIAKTLTPIMIAASLAFEGAGGRALVMGRMMEVAAGSMAAARGAATGLMTMLGGPFAVAIGVATTALVLMAGAADQAKQAKEALNKIDDDVYSAASRIKSLRHDLSDESNPELQRAAGQAIANEVRKAREAVEKESAEIARLTQAQDAYLAQMEARWDNLSERQRDLIGKNAQGGIQSPFADEIDAARKRLEDWRAVQNSIQAELDRNPEAPGKPIGLPEIPDPSEAEAHAKAWKGLLDGIPLMAAEYRREMEAEGEALQAYLADLEDAAALAAEGLSKGLTGAAIDLQLEKQEEMLDLLAQHSRLYAAMGPLARTVAAADAARAVSAREIAAWSKQQAQTNAELARLPKLADALGISADQYEVLQATYDIMDQFPGLTEQAAQQEARKLIAVQKTTAELERQAARARDLAKAPGENFLTGLERASDDFWTGFVGDANNAFDDLGNSFKRLWKGLLSDILRRDFEPWLNKIKGAISGAGLGGQAVSGTIVIQQAAAGVGATTTGSAPEAGAAAGQASSGVTSRQFTELGDKLSSAVGTIAQVAAYGQLGSSVAALLMPTTNAKNQQIGSGIGTLVGGIIGTYFGSTMGGAAVGGGIGGGIGGMLGPKPNNNATTFLDELGEIIRIAGDKQTPETRNAVQSAADIVQQGQALLKEMGATLNATVLRLDLGIRDVSKFRLSSDPEKEVATSSVGSPDGLASEALRAVLDAADFSSKALNQVKDAMLAAGASFEKTMKVLGNIADVLPDLTEPLSEWGEALKKVRETFEYALKTAETTTPLYEAYVNFHRDLSDAYGRLTARDEAHILWQLGRDVGNDGKVSRAEYGEWHYANVGRHEKRFRPAIVEQSGAVEEAYQATLAALRDSFNSSITNALGDLRSPMRSEVRDLLESQQTRVEDAQALGGDMAAVLDLNAEELKRFVEGAATSTEAFIELTAEMTAMRAEAAAAGKDMSALTAAIGEVKIRLRSDFEQGVTDAIMAIESPRQLELRDLLRKQTDRLAAGSALDANLTDVMQLNTLELRQFIESASGSADAFLKLNEEFAALRSEAVALGRDVALMDEAFASARTQVAEAFNASIADQLLSLANPTMASFKALMDGQKARLDQAKAIGASLTAVERLNAAETQKFFESLNDDQLRGLGDYLGVIGDFTGQIGVTLLNLRQQVDKDIAGFEVQRADLEQQRDALRSGGEALLDLRRNLLDRYSDLSPQSALDEIRARFGRLAEEARAGNASAVTALPQVADQLIQQSRSLFGSTVNFRNDLDGVTAVLEEIGQSSMTRADAAQVQLDTLEASREALFQIRDLLAENAVDAPGLAALTAQLGTNSTAVASLVETYLTQLANRDELDLASVVAAATAAAKALQDAQAIQQPTAPISIVPTTQAPPPEMFAPTAQGTPQLVTPTAQATQQPAGTNEAASADSQAAEATGELIMMTAEHHAQMLAVMESLVLEYRRNTEILLVA
jgi:tape measure domain-containing protein